MVTAKTLQYGVTSFEWVSRRLAMAGLLSRKDAYTAIQEGKIRVNGQIIDKDFKVPEQAYIEWNGQICPPVGFPRLWGFNKPVHCLATMDEREGIKTIGGVLRGRRDDGFALSMPENVTIISGLPANAEGLVLLTNNGDFATRFRNPANRIQSTFLIRVHGDLPQDNLRKYQHGAKVKGVDYGPVWVEVLRRAWKSAWLRVRMVESKERDLGMLMEDNDLEMRRLRRYAIGPYRANKMEENEATPLQIHKSLMHLTKYKKRSMSLMPAQSISDSFTEPMQAVFNEVNRDTAAKVATDNVQYPEEMSSSSFPSTNSTQPTGNIDADFGDIFAKRGVIVTPPKKDLWTPENDLDGASSGGGLDWNDEEFEKLKHGLGPIDGDDEEEGGEEEELPFVDGEDAEVEEFLEMDDPAEKKDRRRFAKDRKRQDMEPMLRKWW